MIVLVIVRRAQCEICSGQFDLSVGEQLPDKCKLCGSLDWMWGVESRESRYIRQGYKKKQKVLDRGATSLKRQERGRRQWQGFKPKPEMKYPFEQHIRVRQHDITLQKATAAADWYIMVRHPSGCYSYDGWWRDSETATVEETLAEAKRGACI